MLKNNFWMTPLPLKCGRALPTRIFPGPMEGIMTPRYCQVFQQLNLTDCWMTPFIRISTSPLKKRALEQFIAPFMTSGLPVIVQLMGRDTALMLKTVEQLKEFDIAGINLNFACPSRRVMKKGNGGKFLLEPTQMRALLTAIRQIIPNQSLSVKLRSGYNAPQEMEQIIPACVSSDIDFIVIHYRTVMELYQPVKDGVKRLKRAVELAEAVPVIGSGDIFTPADAESMRREAGVAGVIAARGLLRDPWLIRRIQGGAVDGDKGRFLEFFSIVNSKSSEAECSRGYLLELARNLWGIDSPQFCKLSGRNPKEQSKGVQPVKLNKIG